MTVETTLVKRRALYRGEVGFFPDNEMAAEAIATTTMNTEVACRFSSPRTLKRLNYLWAIVYKTWQNTDYWISKEKAMEDLKFRVHFTRRVFDRDERKYKQVPDTLTRINDEQLGVLTDRIIDYICAEILPGMERDDLRREVEEMFQDRAS